MSTTKLPQPVKRNIQLTYEAIHNKVSSNIEEQQAITALKITPTAIEYQKFSENKFYAKGTTFSTSSVLDFYVELYTGLPILEITSSPWKGSKVIGIRTWKRAPIGGYVSDDSIIESSQQKQNADKKHYRRPYYTVFSPYSQCKPANNRATDMMLMKIDNYSFVPFVLKYVNFD